eukprot:scaffold84329_cov64-Phaeocystis_antarctica.AAC.1
MAATAALPAAPYAPPPYAPPPYGGGGGAAYAAYSGGGGSSAGRTGRPRCSTCSGGRPAAPPRRAAHPGSGRRSESCARPAPAPACSSQG